MALYSVHYTLGYPNGVGGFADEQKRNSLFVPNEGQTPEQAARAHLKGLKKFESRAINLLFIKEINAG